MTHLLSSDRSIVDVQSLPTPAPDPAPAPMTIDAFIEVFASGLMPVVAVAARDGMTVTAMHTYPPSRQVSLHLDPVPTSAAASRLLEALGDPSATWRTGYDPETLVRYTGVEGRPGCLPGWVLHVTTRQAGAGRG